MASDAFISEADDLMEKLNNMTDDAAKDFEEDDNNDENDNNSALNVSWADAATSDEDEEEEEEGEEEDDNNGGNILDQLMNNNNNDTETNDNNNNNNNNNNINNDSTNEQPEKEMISAEDLEKLLIETMNSKPKANVGKISKVENVADIPVVPFKKRFVPTRAPKTVIGQYQEPLMARPSSDIKGYKKKYRRIQRNTAGKGKKKGGRRYVNEDNNNNRGGSPTRFGKFKVDSADPTAVSGDKFDENVGGYVSDGETGEPTLFVNTFKDMDDDEAMRLWQRKISKSERLRREERNMANNLKKLGIQYHKSDLKHDSPINADGNKSPGRGGKNFNKKRSPLYKNNNKANNTTGATAANGWYGNNTFVTRMLRYFLPIFIFTMIVFRYNNGSPIKTQVDNIIDDEKEMINNVQLNFFHPLPIGTIGMTQQPTIIAVDLLGYNNFLSKFIDDDNDNAKIPKGKFTVWINGNETATEMVALPMLDEKRQEVYRWRAAVSQILPEKKHLVRVVYEINGVTFSNATTFTVVPDPPNAKVSIITPAKGQVLAVHGSETTTVQWRTDDFIVPRDGYFQIILNDNEPKVVDYEATMAAELDQLTPGKHKVVIALLSRFNENKILHQDEVVFTIVEKKSATSTPLGELELLKGMSTNDLEFLLEDKESQLNSLRREIIEKILDERWKAEVRGGSL